MATGIDVRELSNLKVKLLDYIESINGLSKRFENCSYNIDHYMAGPGKAIFMKHIGSIREQIPIVTANINSYIGDMNRVQSVYQSQDQELVSQVTSDITLLDHMKGE